MRKRKKWVLITTAHKSTDNHGGVCVLLYRIQKERWHESVQALNLGRRWWHCSAPLRENLLENEHLSSTSHWAVRTLSSPIASVNARHGSLGNRSSVLSGSSESCKLSLLVSFPVGKWWLSDKSLEVHKNPIVPSHLGRHCSGNVCLCLTYEKVKFPGLWEARAWDKTCLTSKI